MEGFEDQLEAVSERAISADSRSIDNAREIVSLKKVDDVTTASIAKLEEKLATDKIEIANLRTAITEQADINNQQHNSITDITRRLEAVTDRLNGKGLLQVDPYERIVATVRELTDVLRGGEGQLSFSQVRNSIQNTQFLGKVMYGAIGLFGVGAVSAAGLALFGADKVSPEVQAVQDKVAAVQKDVDGLKTSWNDDIQRRLSEAKK